MLSDTSSKWEVVGAPIRAGSYFGNTDGVHTVSVKYDNFRGGFKLQGTLAMNPTEDDWFDIILEDSYCNQKTSFVEYPRDAFAPTGDNGGDTGVDAFTFIGNFTYLRAVQVRRYINETPPARNEFLDYGTIDSVLLMI